MLINGAAETLRRLQGDRQVSPETSRQVEQYRNQNNILSFLSSLPPILYFINIWPFVIRNRQVVRSVPRYAGAIRDIPGIDHDSGRVRRATAFDPLYAPG